LTAPENYAPINQLSMAYGSEQRFFILQMVELQHTMKNSPSHQLLKSQQLLLQENLLKALVTS
jgi:hypothetical protein